MDFSHDQLRREARTSQIEHEEALPRLREMLSRILERPNGLSPDQKQEVILGMNRRRALRIGGITILGGALLAACGSDSNDAATTTTAAAAGTTGAPATDAATTAAAATPTTGAAAVASGDVLILRTASSIEELAVAAYQTAIDSGLVTTAAIADAAKLFQAQHMEHSGLFQSLTTKAGGDPFKDPNPAILEAIQPSIDALKDEMGVVALALELENVAAQTYQSNVATFMDPALNTAIMSVGGVEARHAAALAGVLKQAQVPAAFQVTDKAVKAGTGV
jgi:rubrerythrin